MPRVDFRPRVDTHAMSAVDFGYSPSLKTQELAPKLWGSLSPPLALKLFLESFYTWMKVRSMLNSHSLQSALHTLSVDHIKLLLQIRLGNVLFFDRVPTILYFAGESLHIFVIRVKYNKYFNRYHYPYPSHQQPPSLFFFLAFWSQMHPQVQITAVQILDTWLDYIVTLT